ncbi:MAG: hypothetical protein IJF66_07000, partial [Clostridia bacterium]|nr:hypothetical protein [Clostridia bacterium]
LVVAKQSSSRNVNCFLFFFFLRANLSFRAQHLATTRDVRTAHYSVASLLANPVLSANRSRI